MLDLFHSDIVTEYCESGNREISSRAPPREESEGGAGGIVHWYRTGIVGNLIYCYVSVQYNTILYSNVSYDTVQYNTIPYRTI